MGKNVSSQKVRQRKRTNWLIHKIKFAKEAYYNNINKRQKKEHQDD